MIPKINENKLLPLENVETKHYWQAAHTRTGRRTAVQSAASQPASGWPSGRSSSKRSLARRPKRRWTRRTMSSRARIITSTWPAWRAPTCAATATGTRKGVLNATSTSCGTKRERWTTLGPWPKWSSGCKAGRWAESAPPPPSSRRPSRRRAKKTTTRTRRARTDTFTNTSTITTTITLTMLWWCDRSGKIRIWVHGPMPLGVKISSVELVELNDPDLRS